MKLVMIFDTRPWWQKMLNPLDNQSLLQTIRENFEKENTTILMPGLRAEILDVIE